MLEGVFLDLLPADERAAVLARIQMDYYGPDPSNPNLPNFANRWFDVALTANLGDTKTTITHPASTSHGRLTEEQRLAAGITQGMIRVAVGLDDVADIEADLARGLTTL